jgi:hypothetical protein
METPNRRGSVPVSEKFIPTKEELRGSCKRNMDIPYLFAAGGTFLIPPDPFLFPGGRKKSSQIFPRIKRKGG